MTKLIICVVAHEKRTDMACQLATTVQADHVFVDNGSLGEWKNHERAWKLSEKSDATHAVILQDDAVPISEFRKHVEKAINCHPDKLISLYVGTHRPRREEVLRSIGVARRENASWLTCDTLMWGVAVVVPVALVPEILASVSKSKLPYDQRIGLWAETSETEVYYTWPSLVDHADADTVVRGRSKAQGVRVAHEIGVPNWSDVTVKINKVDNNFLSSKRDIR